MINEKETQKEKEKIQFLKKKTNRSFEKEIKIIDNISKNEITKKIKTIEELTEILSSCLNPYYICNNKIITLDNKTNIKEFLNNQEVNQIYQNIKNDDFKQIYINYYKDFIESEINDILIKYPLDFKLICPFPYFYFNFIKEECIPKYYKSNNNTIHYKIDCFFQEPSEEDDNIFYYYSPSKIGTSLMIMKFMSREKMYYIYIDLKKIILIIKKKDFNSFQNFIKYSLTFFEPYLGNIEKSFNHIIKYFNFILKKVYHLLIENKLTLHLFLSNFLSFIHEFNLPDKSLNFSFKPRILIILDHYNQDLKINLNEILILYKECEFFIVNSFESLNDNLFFVNLLNNKSFENVSNDYNNELCLYNKEKKVNIGYYHSLNPLFNEIFDDFEILKLYKDLLLQYFNLDCHFYFLKFLDFAKSKQVNSYNLKIFEEFIEDTKTEIKLNIDNFYNHDKINKNYYILKYLNLFSEINNNENENQNLDYNIKKEQKNFNISKLDLIKFLPLNYFTLKFKNGQLISIEPSFNLILIILNEIIQNEIIILYQSQYYETLSQSEKGNIFQKVVEVILQIDSKTIFNKKYKTIFKHFSYLFPPINDSQKDPVFEFYNSKSDIEKYLTKIEKNDMELLIKEINKDLDIKNIFIYQISSIARIIDFCLLKLMPNNKFILLMFQVTISESDEKFTNTNLNIEKFFFYISEKFEKYLINYKSLGIHLIYILPKDIKKEQINFKKKLSEQLKNNVHLMFLGKNCLKFFYKNNNKLKLVKEIKINNSKIEFIDDNFLNEDLYYKKIQENVKKIIKTYSLNISNMTIINYNFKDLFGNFLIVVKKENEFYYIININDKIIYLLIEKNDIFQEISSDLEKFKKINGNEIGYCFEILNHKDIKYISPFTLEKI